MAITNCTVLVILKLLGFHHISDWRLFLSTLKILRSIISVFAKEYQKSLVLPLFLVVFAIVFWFVAIPPISGLEIPAPAGPTYGASIDIMAKTLGSQPVFGSGLETFHVT